MKQLTNEDAQKILYADLNNIIAKVKAGKTLSKAERELFEKHTAEDEAPEKSEPLEKAKGWADLAKRLGMSRQNLMIYRKRNGAPLEFSDVQSWETFLAISRAQPEQSTELYARKLLAETRRSELLAERLTLALETDKGKLIPADKIINTLTDIAARTKATLLRLETDLPAELAGLSESECAQVIRKHLDRLCAQMVAEFQSHG